MSESTKKSKKNDLYDGMSDLDSILESVMEPNKKSNQNKLGTYVDLFCGIGGFHIAANSLGLDCVFACDIDANVRTAYQANYGITPFGDITSVDAKNIPDHDLLCAGFPCQPFSIIGSRKGFGDPRGGMFKEILRVIKVKRPKAILLENVKQLSAMQEGKVLASIKSDIQMQGYYVDSKVLNALSFGVPQKRERIFIVATRKDIGQFAWPDKKVPMRPLSEVLEKAPHKKHFVSDRIKSARKAVHQSKFQPSIWHENKSGHISSYPFSCALRAGASYNYLLVDGERRLSPREMLRLQGFPDSFKIVCNDSQTRKQAGNSVPVPMVRAVLASLLDAH